MPLPSGLSNGKLIYESLLDAAHCYSLLLAVNGALCALLFPLILFLVARKSPPEMSASMRRLLLSSTAACLLSALFQALYVPVPLHPFLGPLNFGVFRRLNPRWNVLGFIVWSALLMNMFVNCLFAFCHCYALMRPSRLFFQRNFRQVNARFWTLYASVFATLLGLYILNVCLLTPSASELAQYVHRFRPEHFVRVLHANEPSLTGQRQVGSTPGAKASFAVLCALVATLALLIVVLNVGTLLEIRRTRKSVIQNTHNLQVSAYFHLFFVKTLLLALFFLLPFAVESLAVSGVLHSPVPQLFGFLFFGLHSLATMLHTVLYVRPYREWICALLRGLFPKRKTLVDHV